MSFYHFTPSIDISGKWPFCVFQPQANDVADARQAWQSDSMDLDVVSFGAAMAGGVPPLLHKMRHLRTRVERGERQP